MAENGVAKRIRILLKAVLDLHLLTRNRRLGWMDVAWNTTQLMNRAHTAT